MNTDPRIIRLRTEQADNQTPPGSEPPEPPRGPIRPPGHEDTPPYSSSQGNRDDSAGAWAPPPEPETDKPKRGTNARRLQGKITEAYASIGFITCAIASTKQQMLGEIPAGTPADHPRMQQSRQNELLYNAGTNAINTSSAVAEAWMELADQNPAVKTALERMTEGSAIASVVITNAMFIIPFGIALGWVPEVIGERMGGMSAMMNGNGGATQ